MTRHLSLFAVSLFAVALTGCDDKDASDLSDTQFKNEAALVSNAQRGMPVLIKRLHQSLKFDGDVFLLEGDLVPGSSAVSKNAAWTIACGNGVTIYFEKTEIDLVSVEVAVSDAQCAVIDKALGKEIAAMTG